MEFWKSASQCCLAVISFIYWIASGGLVFVAVWLFQEYCHYSDVSPNLRTVLLPTFIILCAGIVLFLLGVIGCIATFKEQKCLIGLFFTLQLLIFVGLLAGAILAFVYRSPIDDTLRKELTDGLNKYTIDYDITADIDFMQSELKCCGVNNASDWLNTLWYQNQTDKSHRYPHSCCPDDNCIYYGLNEPYPQGCYALLKNQFQKHLLVLLCVGAGVALMQVFGMVCACVLLCRRRTEEPYIRLTTSTDGMHV